MSFDASTDRRLNLPPEAQGEGMPATVCMPVVDMRAKPNFVTGIDTQLLWGAAVKIYQQENGWALVQAETDGYVGFVPADHLCINEPAATHKVIVPRTMVYTECDMKKPSLGAVSLGSRFHVKSMIEQRGTNYAVLADGKAIVLNHLQPGTLNCTDPVTVAETLLHTPYLWGGASAFGIDCSGLVQLCFALCGHNVLRDTDMQSATIGAAIQKSQLQRGDLIFWKGHVAFYCGHGAIIHANGHTMNVAIEEMDMAVERIAYLYGQPTVYRSLLSHQADRRT